MKKYDTVIFDLDGVLIDSKKNMRNSWGHVKKKMKLSQSFKKYFDLIGYPFERILNKIGIFNDINKIKKIYQTQSIFNLKYVKIHKDVIQTLETLKKNKIKLGLVTSKDIKRTKIIIKKFKIPIKTIISPRKKLRGKPFPDQIFLALKKLMSSKKKTCYVGDMLVDFKAAQNAKVGFIFADYGYGKKKNYFKNIIYKPRDILKFTI
jgi:phosphoglycolate phosphatase